MNLVPITIVWTKVRLAGEHSVGTSPGPIVLIWQPKNKISMATSGLCAYCTTKNVPVNLDFHSDPALLVQM